MHPDDKYDQPEMCEDPLKNLILLTMPWLCFQRGLLEVAKKTVLDASSVKPAATFALHELHALRMVLDPMNTMQDRCDPDLERKAKGAYDELLPKLTSASVQIIEAQQKALDGILEGLKALRKGDQPYKRSEGET
jgi:hypothetical protein